MKALTLPSLPMIALAAIGCDDTAAPTTTPMLTTGALTGLVDLTFSVRGVDGIGAGAVRFVDDATGAALGACDGACVVPVPRDARVRLIATPAPGSAFAGWRNVCWGAPADGCVVHVTWHLPAGADFRAAPPPAPTTWDLTLAPESADGLGAGGVRVHDEAGARLGVCGPGARCVVPVPRGARVRLVADPELGSIFSAWRNVCWGDGREDCVVDVSWHMTVHVAFAADPRRDETEEARLARRLAEARAYLAPERGRTLGVVFAPLSPPSPVVERDGDDDPTPRLRVPMRDGRERTFQLLPRAAAEIAAADALRAARDVRHRARLYRALWYEARTLGDEVAGRFPDPAVVPDDPIVLGQALDELSQHLVDHAVFAEPLGLDLVRVRACLEGDPAGEVGTGDGLDMTALTLAETTSCEMSPDGLFLNYEDFPRASLSCVKDQGARGTCTAFSVTSATEAALHQRYGEHVNLSEQHMYGLQSGANYTKSEGAFAGDYFERLATYSGFYRFVHETVWQYNQALERVELSFAEYDAQPAYPKYFYEDSCVGYYETCSDNVAQCPVSCSDPEYIGSCDVDCPALVGPQYRFTWEATELWDAEDVDGALVRTHAKLILGHQLVVSMGIPAGFGAPDANGFLSMPADDEVLGYHAMHVVGYITNSALADVLPGAPVGQGGGWFIVKNSWGPCFADGGYVYVPRDYMRDFAYSMRSFTRWYVEKAP